MLTTKGAHTLAEIMDQPSLWQQVVKVYNRERETLVWIKKMQFTQVVFMGEGASNFAARYASMLFTGIGKMQSFFIHPSDVFAQDCLPFDPRYRTLVVAVSRSGLTDETLWAVEMIKKLKPDIQVLSLICREGTPLQELSDRVILVPGAEEEILPIKSFSSMVYLFSLMAGAIGGDKDFLAEMSKIPQQIDIRDYYEKIGKIRKIQTVKRAIFMGSGHNLPLAAYASMLTKEMSMTPAYYYNSFEFRHNNYVTAHDDTLLACLLSNRLYNQEMEAVRDGAKMRAMVLLLSDYIDEKSEAGVEFALKLNSSASPFAQSFYMIVNLQLLAYQESMVKGLNPDKPRNMVDVVTYKTRPRSLME